MLEALIMMQRRKREGGSQAWCELSGAWTSESMDGAHATCPLMSLYPHGANNGARNDSCARQEHEAGRQASERATASNSIAPPAARSAAHKLLIITSYFFALLYIARRGAPASGRAEQNDDRALIELHLPHGPGPTSNKYHDDDDENNRGSRRSINQTKRVEQ